MAGKADIMVEVTVHRLRDQQKAAIFLGGALAATALYAYLVNRRRTYSISYLVNPELVASLANSIDARAVFEDDFIAAAWQTVYDRVKYANYDTDIFFINHSVSCNRCYTPLTVLKAGTGNCVAMASLLTSLLRTRISPERVYMAVGLLEAGGYAGGHAWVEVMRDDTWYLAESTSQPMLWLPRDNARGYQTLALFNDVDYICYSNEVCALPIASCDCAYYKSLTPEVALWQT